MKNKKFMLLLGSVATFLLVFIVVGSVFISEDLHIVKIEEVYEEAEELYISQIDQIRAGFPDASEIVHLNEVFAHLTQEDFIYDVEYLVYALRNNFAQTVILDQRGFIIEEMGQNVIERILANENINIRYFWDVLWYEFFQDIWWVGHLAKLNHSIYRTRLDDVLNIDGSIPQNRVFVGPLISNPNTLLLYGDVLSLTENPPFITGRNVLVGRGYATRPFHANQPNITTNIIEENRIGNIRINNPFSRHISENDWQTVREFYEEIEDFEHLIIDMRGYIGGWTSYFFNLIMAPLVNETLTHTFVYFHKDGDHIMNRMRGVHRITSYGRPLGSTSLASEEALDMLPESHHWAIEYFDYFRTERIQVARSGSRIGNFDFNGEIWFLVNSGAMSGGQWVTSFIYETGFATIVGETTGGAVGGSTSMIFFSLPNTGIIIQFDYGLPLDRQGRPLEDGTIPHIYSNDALNAALELIGQ